MKEEDIYNDILSNYPEEKILAFCVDAITKRYNSTLKALGSGNSEVAMGALGELNFYLQLLAALRDKQNNVGKETVVVA